MECEENSTAEAFNDLIIQFGYISLFSVAFPPASLFCYVCNMITMRSIMSEFKYKQRQLPEISIGIGQYLQMIEMISFITVIINSAIALFTSNRVEKYLHKGDPYKFDKYSYLLIILGCEHALIVTKFIIRMLYQGVGDRFFE